MLKSFYNMLQPIYPLLAQQFIDDYELENGICIDIGTGPGFIGIEIAKVTNMVMYFVDADEEQLKLAQSNFAAADCDNIAHFIKTDVHRLDFEDNLGDFIVSRGSIWFWAEPRVALREVYRVLKPGGTALIGGGLGRYVPATMRKRLTDANKKRLAVRGEKRPTLKEFQQMVLEADLPGSRVISEQPEIGRWVEIKKPGR